MNQPSRSRSLGPAARRVNSEQASGISGGEVVVAEGEEIWGSYGETAAYIARWLCPFWRALAGFVAIGSCSSAANPLVRCLCTARTNSHAVSLRDWIRRRSSGEKTNFVPIFFAYASLSRHSTSGVSTGYQSICGTWRIFWRTAAV